MKTGDLVRVVGTISPRWAGRVGVLRDQCRVTIGPSLWAVAFSRGLEKAFFYTEELELASRTELV